MNKSLRRPVVDPIKEALKSRRVIIAIVTFLAAILTVYVPEWEGLRSELLTIALTLALFLIGGLSIEDAINAARGISIPDQSPEEAARGVLDAVLDETLGVPTDELLIEHEKVTGWEPEKLEQFQKLLREYNAQG